MLGDKQEQNVENNSTAIQAGRDIIVGVTADEARNIALDVAKVTFYELSGAARQTASDRVEDITDKVINKLKAEFPAGLQKAQDPDFQYALLTVQKEYARNGDEELGDLLVDLLVDRSKQDNRNILQIVLNESLATAPKLTDAQLSCLAIAFLFRYTQNHKVLSHDDLGQYFDKNVMPFKNNIVKNSASYQHLEFTGCGSIQMGGISLEDIFIQTYQGLFLKGFDASEIIKRDISIGYDKRLFIPCLNDPTKIQVSARDKEVLEQLLDKYSVPNEDKNKIVELFNHEKMNSQEIRQKCIEIRPYMEEVFDIWSNSSMKSFSLTSVGMAIGHANIKRFTGEFADLSIWVN
ncbi:LPO_1073/Vpar_1526 family protein [Photobacterium damselae]|uniref:LPO_1073/Vpar_1526 family protein n=1 Tax=Photobacterium damselae TaxID=38293 RepID=UPI0040690EB3